ISQDHTSPLHEIPQSQIMKGITNIPCLHNGSRTGSEGSKTANSYKAIEPAQPETRAVCIICTASNRLGSFNTTV
uniref:Uncharacterized protein n=2 Tax=Aegilops tauschii subsp. strangulata TaxID=200361 RepID=A0A453H2W6_AEGTS